VPETAVNVLLDKLVTDVVVVGPVTEVVDVPAPGLNLSFSMHVRAPDTLHPVPSPLWS